MRFAERPLAFFCALDAEGLAARLANGFESDPPEPTPAELAAAVAALPLRPRTDRVTLFRRLAHLAPRDMQDEIVQPRPPWAREGGA